MSVTRGAFTMLLGNDKFKLKGEIKMNNQDNVKQGQQGKATREKTSIRLNQAEMEGVCKSKFITSTDLMDMINKVFDPVSPDYNGCNVQVLGNGQIACLLFFAEKPGRRVGEGQFKILESTVTAGTDMENRAASIIARHNNRNRSSRRYQLTQDAMDAFEEFIPNLPKFKSYNRGNASVIWNNVVREEQEQAQWGTQAPVFVSIPIDLSVLFGKVYGTKAEGNSPYHYLLTANRPLTTYKEPNGNLVATSWLFLITQITVRALEEVSRLCGAGPMQNTLGIYRGGMKNI